MPGSAASKPKPKRCRGEEGPEEAWRVAAPLRHPEVDEQHYEQREAHEVAPQHPDALHVAHLAKLEAPVEREAREGAEEHHQEGHERAQLGVGKEEVGGKGQRRAAEEGGTQKGGEENRNIDLEELKAGIEERLRAMGREIRQQVAALFGR